MMRFTHERSSGIKTGYWSPHKKDELIERLAEYENTGMRPQEIYRMKAGTILKAMEKQWIPIEERLPETDDYILISFENFSIPIVGRYEVDEEGGAFYEGDDDLTCASYELFANAWMPLPEPYRPEDDSCELS